MINICLLGATGSIGSQTLDIIRNDNNYRLVGMSFGSNIEFAVKIIDEFSPLIVSCKTKDIYDELVLRYPNLKITYGEEGINSVVEYDEIKGKYLVINALVGSVGLIPTYKAILKKRDVLLANKETLVIGGEIIMDLARRNNVNIIPIDSEHSAIFQLLNEENKKDLKRLIITASGGPFLRKSLDDLFDVSVEDALKHPNWVMGKKITIDSATLMNKGFEIIEAHYLFNVDKDRITAIIHPQSIVHSMVEFNDGSIFAQMGSSDMHLPIQYALKYPHHEKHSSIKSFDFSVCQNLSFEPLDEERFKLVKLAKDMLVRKNIYPTIMNAANEIAVELFLNKKIKFIDIENIIINEVNDSYYDDFIDNNLTIEKIILVDKTVKERVFNKYSSKEDVKC